MDMQAKRDMETMAEWASTMDAYDRLVERRARRHKVLHFWLNAHQIVYAPTVAEPTSEGSGSPSTSGVGPGSVGSRDSEQSASPNSPAVGERLPGRPHLPV